MKRTIRIILSLVGFIILGTASPAYGQTGDCYASLAGCLDPNFGVNGRVTTPAGMYAEGVAVQHVGGEARIVSVGYLGDAWAIARYRAGGTLDTSFGIGGVVQQSFNGGSGRAYAVAVQPDNKLVVVGYAPTSGKTSAFTIARYDENGSLDASFGNPACKSGGMVIAPCPYIYGLAWAVALQSEGKIVATGMTRGSQLVVVRLNSDGSMDSTFNGSGQYVYSDALSEGHGVAIQTIGSQEFIAVAGSVARVPAVFRLTSQGAPDSSFGNGGVIAATLSGSYDNTFRGLAVDSSNRLLALGSPDGVNVVGYDQSGHLDPSFGVGGIVKVPMRTMRDFGNAIAVQPDGRILVAGRGNSGNDYFAAWRFLANGAVDNSFGVNGWVTTIFPDDISDARAIALQPDGKFVLAGYSRASDGTRHPPLARYFGYLAQPAHDIAVYGISATPTVATQGDLVTVQVTISNNGMNTETADVMLTETPDGNNLGAQSVSLAPGETATLTLTWQTSTYTSTGVHTLLGQATMTTPGVTDEQPANNTRSSTVSVATAGLNIVLSARGYKVRSNRAVDLSWTGASASFVDIYRNGAQRRTTANTGAYTDIIGGTGSVTYIYKVCDAGSTRCSNSAPVVF